MKRLLLNMMFFFTVQGATGQFKEFVSSAGLIYSKGRTITHFATAGGGIVLKGAAKPKYPDSLLAFTGVKFKEGRELSTLYITTAGSTIYYADTSWIMRDAAMLVKSQMTYQTMAGKIYRDVNLLGGFTINEVRQGLKSRYSPRFYYNVEMADSLCNTKSGQTLLYMDIMLASEANTSYYSNNEQAVRKFEASTDSLADIIDAYNYSIESTMDKRYSKLQKLDSLKKTSKFDIGEVEKHTKEIVDSRSKFSHQLLKWNDYTYNDENTKYLFYKIKNRLKIDGQPNYTFLVHNYSFSETDAHESPADPISVDSIFTIYHIQHPELIKNLNYEVVTNAEHFSKIAAFFRFLSYHYPSLWQQVFTHYVRMRKTKGYTPRFIKINPLEEN